MRLTKETARIAVLYQSSPTPTIYNVVKPMKQNGYRDGSADIAYALKNQGYHVVCPSDNPNPTVDDEWVFPDTQEQIDKLLRAGINFIWTNTVLHKDHPVYRMPQESVSYFGQNQSMLQDLDDKAIAYDLMSQFTHPVLKHFVVGNYTNPKLSHIRVPVEDDAILEIIQNKKMYFPLVVKPIRGRGSEGVRVVKDITELIQAVKNVMSFKFDFFGKNYPRFGGAALVESFLPGTEITITVLPPGIYTIHNRQTEKQDYWTLPILKRTGHQFDILPSIGDVPPTVNAQIIDNICKEESLILDESINFAKKIQSYNPLRLDCRCDENGRYFPFDINIKPAITSGERTKDINKKSLVAMSSEAIGLSYSDLITGLIENYFTFMAHNFKDDKEVTSHAKNHL